MNLLILLWDNMLITVSDFKKYLLDKLFNIFGDLTYEINDKTIHQTLEDAIDFYMSISNEENKILSDIINNMWIKTYCYLMLEIHLYRIMTAYSNGRNYNFDVLDRLSKTTDKINKLKGELHFSVDFLIG